MNIYRVNQEAVHNSIKYAKATEVSVVFLKEVEVVIIKIIDNGIGFDIDTIILGNGIFNIKKRIKETDGTHTLTSQFNVGTEIIIKLPYKKFEK